MKPIAKWNGTGIDSTSDLHWWSQFDEGYIFEVRKTINDKRGLFCIFDHNQDDKLIYTKLVFITKGKVVTPDVANFEAWTKNSEKIIERINKCPKKHRNK